MLAAHHIVQSGSHGSYAHAIALNKIIVYMVHYCHQPVALGIALRVGKQISLHHGQRSDTAHRHSGLLESVALAENGPHGFRGGLGKRGCIVRGVG